MHPEITPVVLTPAQRRAAIESVREATTRNHHEHNALALIADALQRIAQAAEAAGR